MIQLGTGTTKLNELGNKKLFIKVLDTDLWVLRKIDLLAKEPYMRFLKVEKPRIFLRSDLAFAHMNAHKHLIDNIFWGMGQPDLGIVIHKAVIARIQQSMSLQEAKDLINKLAKGYPEGPILNGFLSSANGRLYLTGKDEQGKNIGWGWRLERTRERWVRTWESHSKLVGGNYLVTRHQSRRVRPINEQRVHLSMFSSLLIPIHEFQDSLIKDFGSFADPYSLEHRRLTKMLAGNCVDIPLVRTGQQLKFNITSK